MGQALTSVLDGPGAAAPNIPGSRSETVSLVVEDMYCGACMTTVERALLGVPGVRTARANLSARRATVALDPSLSDAQSLIDTLSREGYRAAEAIETTDVRDARRADDLLRRLGVAGFASANVMLLSVSVWAGAASDMDQSAASLFHWLSALIAMPSIAYAAQPFFGSAAAALRARRLNMDVPISLGITLATSMSLFQTVRGSHQVYFDAAIMLTFFLLIGRFLDEQVRIKARGAAENLLGLKALTATVIGGDGAVQRMAARLLKPGMQVYVAAGERVPVDGRVVSGKTDIDESLITGETLPRWAEAGSEIHAGTLNMTAAVIVEATATDDSTLLAEIARLMQAAEQGRGQYVRLADRASRLYAPAVHVLGAATFIGWMLIGAGWEAALTYATAVLIITCPCALALAVPAVQVAATSRLFGKGVIVKAADGLERLAETDTVVFDKTGTLTRGEPVLRNGGDVSDAVLVDAASLAVASRHPYSKAVVRAARARGLAVVAAQGVLEVPGSGLLAPCGEGERRLGSEAWVTGTDTAAQPESLWYDDGNGTITVLRFEDELRPDARVVVSALKAAGYEVSLLSGDRPAAVERAARAAGIDVWSASVRPDGKIAAIEALKAQGRRVLMVGDGLNDAPALAAAYASLSPSTATDISQTAADAVFQGQSLAPILETLAVARATQRMSLENFGIAIAYNIVFVPLAIGGWVTPLIAALAMSLSSIAVTVNALRLRRRSLSLASMRRMT
ncbi:heavy metal translocating P-type ATPase [Hyphomicrobium sp.]|uniref:heavy metal translocating P-type ATPase n=1 Tax=Hyphomicrobium sp. TaxID=82 RepID=UPI002E34DC80|nr:heavy metal translocating P-type ATPase [Hyphomicrobium sp.]HEX2842529.1 heavy metal translocating P-type ATPase [Hyphomicrobium sp.]